MKPTHSTNLMAEPLLDSDRRSEKQRLLILQSKLQFDPEGNKSELLLIHSQFISSIELFHQQAAMNFNSITGIIASDSTVAKYLGDRAMFLAYVACSFGNPLLPDFPKKLADLLHRTARLLPSELCFDLAHALALLVNRQVVGISATLSLFMELQTLGDRKLMNFAFRQVVLSIQSMNKKYKNHDLNGALQSAMFKMLQGEDEAKAKRALMTLGELYRRKVWFDDGTASAICTASFHPASEMLQILKKVEDLRL